MNDFSREKHRCDGRSVWRRCGGCSPHLWNWARRSLAWISTRQQVNRLSTRKGGQFYHCDVSDVASWEETTSMLSDRLDAIDHLHLNAGIQIAPPEAPLGDYQFSAMNLARYKKMTGVNIDGVVYGLHHLLPLMRAGGSIVVTGSLAGITPYDVDPLYAMTKHAVTGLVRSLKRELGERQLRINALCPGWN